MILAKNPEASRFRALFLHGTRRERCRVGVSGVSRRENARKWGHMPALDEKDKNQPIV